MDGPAAQPAQERRQTLVRTWVIAVLALVAAGLLAARVVSASQRDTFTTGAQMQLLVAAVLACVLSLGAFLTAARSPRWTAWFLGAALLLELVLGLMGARIPLAVAPVLLCALVLVLGPILRRESEPGVDYTRARTVVAVVSVVLMAPIGLFYAGTGLLVPEYIVPVAVLIYLLLLAGTVWLAVRRHWWAAAGPVLAVIIWFGGLWAGEVYFGWTA